MIVFELTESSARFITGMIAVLIVFAILGAAGDAIDTNPFVLMGLAVLALAAGIFALIHSAEKSDVVSIENQCEFIRANGTLCVHTRTEDSRFCEYHGSQAVAALPASIESKPKRKQCGFVREDGTKCRKLKPLTAVWCEQHLKLDL